MSASRRLDAARSRRRSLVILATIGATALAGSAVGGAYAADVPGIPGTTTTPTAGPGYTVKTLHFTVHVGPGNATTCDVIGDLYRPNSATKAKPVPSVLTTNGFGGSKDDQADLAGALAQQGYGVLSYSGLGFGGSGCNIELDDPDWDGKSGSQLVTFLGGGSAATDGTKVDWIQHDAKAHDGRAHAYDPRVGMIGGSYGGQIQYAVAGLDPRLDTIVPIITWNDLSYSLAPNNTSATSGVTYRTPGVYKKEWTTLFFGIGVAGETSSPPTATDPQPETCPNFDPRVCIAKTQMDALGYPTADTLALARHASVASYVSKVRIPTLIAQGEADTLFDLQESVATYQSLRKQGTPVKLVWQSWGHSNSTPAPGELDMAHPQDSYEGRVVLAWFGHYLKGVGATPKQDFSYFRPWVSYTGIATPAYATAPAYPVGAGRRLYLGTGLSPTKPASVASQTFAAPIVPTSYSETSGVDSQLGDVSTPTDGPGTFASWTSGALSSDIDVVGSPKLSVTLSSPAAAASGPGVTVFAKLYDVDAAGKLTLVNKLISPARIAAVDLGKPVTIELPGIVHRVGKGHTLKLVLAGSDLAYGTNLTPQVITATSSPAAPGALDIPVVAGRL
jgi:predicted acyl esterase